MKIGISYDLKESVPMGIMMPEDAMEEYDSPETVEAIADLIESEGHEAMKLGGGRQFLQNILYEKPALVFNISEGLGCYRSREAQVPAVLEMLGIPYTGADPQCLAVCLDKPLAKKLVKLDGIATPNWLAVDDVEELKQADWGEFHWPCFAKPAYDGSSKGIRYASKATSVRELTGLVDRIIRDYHQPALIEEYISGDEITVGVIGNSSPAIVGIMRVLPKDRSEDFVYSLEVKRDWERLVEYECPAQLPADVLWEIEKSSLHIFKTLGCRDFARIDFRLDKDGRPYFLEINPLAGLNPYSSDLPIMARKVGWSYQSLVSFILNAAIERVFECVMVR